MLMFRRGLSVRMASRMLGHVSVQITINICIHWLPKESSEAATSGDAFLRGRGERPAPQ
jgi:integrase